MGPPDRRRRRYRQWWIAIGATAAAAALCLTILVLRRANENEPAKTYKPTPADAAAREKNNSRIASLDLRGVELRQAIRKLREISGVRIRVNWPALSKERVMPETTVDVRLKNVTLNKAIRTVLDDVSCIGAKHEGETGLGHVVEDGAITISSKSELAGHTDTRAYDIHDLIASIAEFRNQHVDNSDSGLNAELHSDPEIVAEIIAVISASVDWESCRQADGSGGEIHETGGRLVVTQSVANHKSIVGLLEDMRRHLKIRGSNPCPEKPTASDVAVGRQLGRKIGEFDFCNTELQKAIDFIRDKSGLNVHVKWHAIARQYIRPATTVNVYSTKMMCGVHSTNKTGDDGVRLKNATFAEALQAVCDDAASEGEPGTGPAAGLDYVVSGGVVTISTKHDLWKKMSFRIYDVGEIISGLAEAQGTPRSYSEIVGAIRTVVSDTIDPGCSRGCDAPVGSISEIGGLLFVSPHMEDHESLARLLGQLRMSFSGQGPEAHRLVVRPSDGLARQQLDATLQKLDFEQMELRAVIQYCRDVSGADIRVRWQALAGEGVKRDTPISVYLQRITLDGALGIIFDSLPPGNSRIGYAIRDGVVEISAEYDLRKLKAFRVYEIRDLIAQILERQGPGTDRDEVLGGMHSLICDTIDPDSWRSAGGQYGVFCRIGELPVITQTIDNHEAIAGLFDNLCRHFKTRNLDPRSYSETQADRAVRKMLEAKVAKLDLDDHDFEQAMIFLRDVSGVNLYINRRSLAENKVKESRKVTVHLKNVTLREAINAVFDSANKSGGAPVGYVVRDGVMWVAAEAKLRRSPLIRIYDARDIIARKMKSTTAPAQGREKAVEGIINSIRKAVAPDSWADAGGDLGRIHEIGGLFVVRQIHRHHESLAALMEKLQTEKQGPDGRFTMGSKRP